MVQVPTLNTAGHDDLTSGRPIRIPPLEEAAWSARQREVAEDLIVGPTVNIYTTLIRHPDLAAAMVNLGRTLRAGGIPGRHREILILRTGCNCGAAYELAQHYRIAKQIGMTDGDMARIRSGPDAPDWDPFEATLCRAADELHLNQTISDATWADLAAVYDNQQLIETAMLVGYYHLVSFMINGLGVPLEEDAEPFPA
jgi:4-carboxymuconolactone decarboxylase